MWTAEQVAAFAGEHAIAARYNIAPTQVVSCIRAGQSQTRDWALMRWGLVPSWATELSIGNRMINARSETVHEKRSFKSALGKRRCLIPTDGYFEWMKTESGKQPYWIHARTGGVLAMAGLWEQNEKLGSADRPLETFTVLTVAANETTTAIHDRMPVFLSPGDWEAWLNPRPGDLESMVDLLRPAANDLLVPRVVSTRVNSPRHDDEQCIEPDDHPAPPGQLDLF
ncbi:SOS response-associated peptidase [Stieleria sp. TO1_6]|nr:SOS response-associated peptidase [Stieleria tagensis]